MTTEGGTHGAYLSEISTGDVKFDSHKSASDEIARLYANDTDGLIGFVSGSRIVRFDKYAIRINSCGSRLLFAEVDNQLKLVKADFCKVPNCSMCQWRRSLKWRAKFLTLLPEIQKNHPSHKWVFLTLTIRNCGIEQLRGTLTHLNGSFRRLYQLKSFPMDGLVKSIEVTRAWDCYHKGKYLGRHGSTWIVRWEYQNKAVLDLKPTDEVHPHLHVTGLVPASYFTGRGYLTQAEWTQMWKQSLRVDYDPVVHIKAVKPKKNKPLLPEPEQFADNPIIADETGIVQAICETLKYTVKEQDLIGTYCQDEEVNSVWLKQMTQQLYKMRRLEYKGTLKNIGKEIEEAVDDSNLIEINENEETGEVPTRELEFRWNYAIKRYVLNREFKLDKLGT